MDVIPYTRSPQELPRRCIREVHQVTYRAIAARGPAAREPPASRPMKQPTDYGGVSRELPYNALAVCVPPLESPLCAPLQQQKHPFPSVGLSDGHKAPAAVADAAAEPQKPTGGPLLSLHEHQQRLHLLATAASAQSPSTGCQPRSAGLEAQAASSWASPVSLREASGGPGLCPASDPCLTVNSTVALSAVGGCSSSSSMVSPLLAVGHAGGSLQLSQIGGVASGRGPMASPKDGWGPVPVHGLPAHAEPWGPLAAPVTGATREAATDSSSQQGQAISVPKSFVVEESTVGERTVGLSQPHQEPQVLLQQLRQNEQMQRQILRNLQQQQQRWRHLVEACEAPFLGGAVQDASEPLGSSSLVVPSAVTVTMPDTVPLMQKRQQQHIPVSLEISMGAPQPSTAAAASPRGRRRRPQASSRQACAHSALLGTPAAGASVGGYESAQQNGSQLQAGANASKAQTWSWKQNDPPALWGSVPPHVDNAVPEVLPAQASQQEPAEPSDGRPRVQPLVSGRLRTTRSRVARTVALHAALSGSPAGEAATVATFAADELGARGSLTDAAVIATAAAISDPGGFCEAPEELKALPAGRRVKDGASRRRGGRRVPGRKGGPPADARGTQHVSKSETKSKSTSSPQSCSRSPSVARTAACAVLGFGSGMPLQTKLADVRIWYTAILALYKCLSRCSRHPFARCMWLCIITFATYLYLTVTSPARWFKYPGVCTFLLLPISPSLEPRGTIANTSPYLLAISRLSACCCCYSGAFQAPAIGLVNLGGGSCFLNVVLQCLAHLQPLRDFYLHYGAPLTNEMAHSSS